MKAHQELKKLLTSKQIQAFVADICHHAYPWSERITYTVPGVQDIGIALQCKDFIPSQQQL